MNNNTPIVLGISGASAQVLGERALLMLLKNNCNVHLILTKGSYEVWKSELGIKVPLDPICQAEFWRNRLNVQNGNLHCYRWNDHSASIASGSFHTMGMVILPCSMGTVGRIASGTSHDLIERTADVHLKESRKIIICPREMPWSLIHLRNLTRLAEAGATISPPSPAWYSQPKNIDDLVDFIVVRVFDALGISLASINRWEGPIQ